jgi:16S rRNA (uracil1498-N3)-methyltransferase
VIPRFFVPGADTSGSSVELPDDEAAHLIRVLRLTSDAEIRVFDGRGREWRGFVDRVTKTQASVRLVEPAAAARESAIGLTLAVSILKGDKTDDVVRDATMLGASEIRPLLTDRSEVRASFVTRGRRIERWRRVAISSAKQCGRAVVPAIHPVVALEDLLGHGQSRSRLAFVEPGASASTRRLNDVPRSSEAELVIGPEGGWTDREVQALAAAGMLVTLGSQTLRADAVPLIALTAVRVAWDDL